jgi:hypothetical protein
MSYLLHKLPEGFIVTSDEKIKGNCTGLEFDLIWGNPKIFEWNHETEPSPESNCKKVIAQQDQIDFSGLAEKIWTKITWSNIDKLAVELEMIDNGYEVNMEGIGGMSPGETCWFEKLEPKFTNGKIKITKILE